MMPLSPKLLLIAVSVLASAGCIPTSTSGTIAEAPDVAAEVDSVIASDEWAPDAAVSDLPNIFDQLPGDGAGDTSPPPDVPHDDAPPLADSEIAVYGDAPETEPNDTVSDTSEPTLPATAPLDCPTIPAMCSTWRSMAWEQPMVPGFVPFAEHPAMDGTAWSEFRPLQVKQVLPHTVRIWAASTGHSASPPP